MLVAPDVRFHRSFLAALREDPAARVPGHAGSVDSLDDPAAFAAYVTGLHAAAEPMTSLAADLVPSTSRWWVVDGEFLARVSIRHQLNHALLTVGGHIGYWVRPSARRQGHGTAAFRTSLPLAYELGVDPALLTCDFDNEASRRMIEAAGGVFDNRLGVKLRYWVPTSG